MTTLSKLTQIKSTFFALQANFIAAGTNGFKAAAIAITDAAIRGGNEKLIKKAFALKPELLAPFAEFSNIEQFKKIATRPLEIAQFVIPFSDILRQIAVDEMESTPAHYARAFFREQRIITPEELRLPETWVDKTAISALSSPLGLPIKIQEGETIYRSFYYTPATPLASPIVIKVQNGYYFPKVSGDRYRLVNSASLNCQKIPTNTSHGLSKAEIRSIIEEHEESKRAKHTSIYNRLKNLVLQGDTRLVELKSAYIKTIEKNDTFESYQPDFLPSLSAEERTISDIAASLVEDFGKEEKFFQLLEEPAKPYLKLKS